jgi:NADH:ubiquinone oxidoreductase subunit H
MDINYIIFIVSALVKCVILVVAILISVAYLTLLERKALGSIQRRLGPNSVGHINI